MGLGALFNDVREMNQRSALADFAQKQYGESNPQLAAYAQVDPEGFKALQSQMFLSQVDPKLQQQRMQQQALLGLIGGEGQQSPAQQNPMQQLAGAQQQAVTPLAQQQPSSGEMSPQEQRLLAIAAPDKFLDYKLNAPKRQQEAQSSALAASKTQQELQDNQLKAENAAKAFEDKKASALQELDNMLGDGGKNQGLIQRAIDLTSDELIGGTVGRTGMIARNTGSPKAGDYENVLNTIKSNTALSKLMEMKANSPTGASGLGALSEKELALLTSNIRGIEPNQSEGQMKTNLSEMRNALKQIRERVSGGSYQSPLAQVGQPTAQPATSKIMINPTTGQKITLQNGKWVPVQ